MKDDRHEKLLELIEERVQRMGYPDFAGYMSDRLTMTLKEIHVELGIEGLKYHELQLVHKRYVRELMESEGF